MYDRWEKIFPGIWKQTIGKPQRTLTGIAGSSPVPTLQEKSDAPFPAQISCDAFGSYTVLRIALLEDEQVFGGGLLFHRTISDHQVYHLRADHYSGVDSGRTHVPTPFIAISNGIGIFCNTPEEIDLYIRTCQRREDRSAVQEHDRVTDADWRCYNTPYFVEISVHSSEAEFILFAGEDLKDCVSRFNLFCGGGFIPPKWGLGLWHRTNMTMDSAAVRQLVLDYQQHGFPLSVIGLEPGWQSCAYPCSYDWSPERFGDFRELIRELKSQNIRVNLWENPCVSEKSSIHGELEKYSGSHLMWSGIVPDYTIPEAVDILKTHHRENHIVPGVGGYKLDESDGLDTWLWPDHAQFPSGISGAEYRNCCGMLFEKLTFELFEEADRRTYGLSRSGNAGAVRFPYVIYNDRYDFKEYVTALCSCGFSGSLWCPEVRSANSPQEFLRRFQLLALSPVLLLNAWANYAVPWMYEECTSAVRDAVTLREQLLPYLYSAFAEYCFNGIPPYRSLFMDYGLFMSVANRKLGELDDTANPYQLVKTHDITDQFIVGASLMAAPLTPDEEQRQVIFPPGKWYDFHTGELVCEQGGSITWKCRPDDPVPLFAPDGAVIPLQIDGKLTIRKFGDKPGVFRLYDDDGETFAYRRGDFSWTEIKA